MSIRHEDTLRTNRSLSIYLVTVLSLTCMALVWSGWRDYRSYDVSRNRTEQHMQIATLRGTIVYLDEVLTMSARLAATTGDLSWEKRYRKFEPVLDAAIEELELLTPDAFSGEAAARTDAANIALVKMENRAFDLVRDSRRNEATELLFGDRYETQKRIYSLGVTRFAKSFEPYLRLADLRGVIVYMDEVLTMSARLAAATGDVQWEQRYRQFEPVLNTAIKEALALTLDAYSTEAAARIDVANIALVEMENRALGLVREVRSDEAKSILFGEEYKTQKRVYSQGMTEFTGAISDAMSAHWKQAQRSLLISNLLPLLMLPLLLVAWLVVFRLHSKWRAALITSNRDIALQSKEMSALNQTLDKRVAERTAELSNRNETLKAEIFVREHMEEQLRASEQSLADAQHLANLGSWDRDILSDREVWSDEQYRIFGYQPGEIEPDYQRFVDAVHTEDQGKVETALKSALNDNLPYDIEIRILRPDRSERTIRAQAEVVRDAECKPVRMIGTVLDITERKRMEEELQKMEKLRSIGILAGGIAHDLNNLLTGIMGNLSLARMSEEFANKDSLIEEAEKASVRIEKLTKQLLTFSRGGAPIRSEVEIGSLLSEWVIFTFRGSNVRCEFSVADDLWHVNIDEGQIQQVINNLSINARQAMPGGGVVKLSAENLLLESGTVRALEAGAYVKISIQDEGGGIPGDIQQQVFDPFFTTKVAGSGLGLATSHSIIEKHCGHISIESAAGIGSTFAIYLPAVTGGEFAQAKMKDAALVTGKGRILLMDDEEMIRDFIGIALGRLGYQVTGTKDGREAIDAYTEAMASGNPFESVILDLTIPGGLGGKDVIEQLREIDPTVNAIVVSGYSNDEVMANFADYGFKGSISKPFDIRELSMVLGKVIGQASTSRSSVLM